MRGRKGKPITLKIAEGDKACRGKRKLLERQAAEPQATRGFPEPPKYLKGRARDAWIFWAEEIAIMNYDRKPDATMLEGAAMNYARAIQSELQLAREGLTLRSKNGMVRANPVVAICNAAWTQVRHFCTEFGLSPASRTRIHMDKVQNKPPQLETILIAPRPPALVEQPADNPTVQ